MRHLGVLGLILLSVLVAGCNRSGSDDILVVQGKVVDGAGNAVANATVCLIPVDLVDQSTISNASVLSGEAELYDEPLEDAVDSGDPAIITQQTNGSGAFSMPSPLDKFFVFVKPAVNDTARLAGGDKCRVAMSAADVAGGLTIKLSGNPSPTANYVGTTTCLVCHSDYYANHKFTAHANGVRVPGVNTPLQNSAKYPGMDDGLLKFTPAMAHTDPGVTVLFYEDFDSGRGFDKFKIFEGATGGGLVYLKAYLWQNTVGNKYQITLENVLNTMDPASPFTMPIELTYGGPVFKQRYLVKPAGRNGVYPFLQYQHQGKNSHYDRTRKVFRDYHADWFWNDTAKLLTLPAVTKTFEANCAGCHMPGYRPFLDPMTNEWRADAVDDANSNYDLDGDMVNDELNVGCEQCHGPGSEHVNANSATRIVAMSRLAPGRSNVVCGFCHDRIAGNGNGLVNDTPLNQQNQFPRPGMRRKDYLANYTTRMAPKASSMWAEFDALHSKSHHQHYSDTLKSSHYRNSRHLVVCADCHTTHDKINDRMLKHSVAPDSPLCQSCHQVDVTQHMIEKVGTPMSGSVTSCVSCHMPRTAKTGAGNLGVVMGTLTGTQADANITYWENDITSHTMVVPSKFTAFGTTPGSAMPAPYTNSCGFCHSPASLASIDKWDSASCGSCHAATHNEWKQSGHANLVTSVTNSTNPSRPGSCFRCHVGQRFVSQMIAGDGAYSGSLPFPNPVPQGCAICHYPHFGNGLASTRLRLEGKVLLPEGPASNPSAGTYVEMGSGRLCVECHNSRRSDPEAGSVAVWNASSNEWRLTNTPHNGNQGETYLGFGAATSYTTAGLDEATIPDTFHATQSFTTPGTTKFNGCVTCHMHKGKTGKPHDWNPVVESCAACHAVDPDWSQWGGADPPTFHKPARGDYDGDGLVEDIAAEYHGLLHRIEAAMTDGNGSGIGNPEVGLGYDWKGGFPYWGLGTQMATPPSPDSAKVARNFVLFEHDLSGAAFHNPSYAFTVLRASWTTLGRELLQSTTWTPPGDEWTAP